jgi:hypothetical protein
MGGVELGMYGEKKREESGNPKARLEVIWVL